MIDSAKVVLVFAVGGCRKKIRPKMLQMKMKKARAPINGRKCWPCRAR